MAKDETEIGFTGGRIPKKKRSPAKEHEFLKKRRENLGTNVGGTQYSSDVNPYLNPRSVREEVLSYLLDEGFATDEKSAEAIMGAMSEAWIESIVEGIDMGGSAPNLPPAVVKFVDELPKKIQNIFKDKSSSSAKPSPSKPK
ncbi:hypothetical protein EBR43_11675 [bacterium]|nr:hypothetical protein [bacterium]